MVYAWQKQSADNCKDRFQGKAYIVSIAKAKWMFPKLTTIYNRIWLARKKEFRESPSFSLKILS